MTPLSHPYLHAIFCDDIRQEVTGKMLHIGVYSGELIASAFPVLLPKLAVIGNHAFPFDDQPGYNGSPIRSVSLVLDEEVLLELDQTNQGSKPGPSEGVRGLMRTFMMAMSPFQLPRPGKLRVKVNHEDGSELVSNALNCRMPTEEEIVPTGIRPS